MLYSVNIHVMLTMMISLLIASTGTLRFHVILHQERTRIFFRITLVRRAALLLSDYRRSITWWIGRAGTSTCFCRRNSARTAVIAVHLFLHILLAKLQVRLTRDLFNHHVTRRFPIRRFQLIFHHHLLDFQLLAHLAGVTDLLCWIEVFRSITCETKANAHRRLVRIQDCIVVRVAMI